MNVIKRFDCNLLLLIFFITSVICVVLFFSPSEALAEGVLSDISDTYRRQMIQWRYILVPYVTRLFWILVGISMVFQFGFALFEGLDLNKLFGSFLRLLIVSGLLYWLIIYGAPYMYKIVTSFTQLGSLMTTSTVGTDAKFGASSIMELGITTCANLIKYGGDGISLSILAVLAALIVLIIFTIIAVNITIEYIVTWFVIYVGVVVLGFGGLFITREWAIAYVKVCIAQGLKLMTIFAIVAVTYVIINNYIEILKPKQYEDIRTIANILVYSVIMLLLIQRVPNVVAGLVGGPLNTNMSIMGSLSAGVGTGLAAGSKIQSVSKSVSTASQAFKASSLATGGIKAGSAMANPAAAATMAATAAVKTAASAAVKAATSDGQSSSSPVSTLMGTPFGSNGGVTPRPSGQSKKS